MAAINGRIAHGAPDPIAAMQLRFPLPPGEQDALMASYEARRAALGATLEAELAQAVYTAYRAGWSDSHMHGLQVRAAEVRAEMACAPGQVAAVVTSRSASSPAPVRRRRA